PSKVGPVDVVLVDANAAGANTAAASATRAAARRLRLRTTERPELVPDEVERRHDDDGNSLCDESTEPSIDDQEMEHRKVRAERGKRDDQEAHPLDADVTPVFPEGPEPVPRVVACDGDEERARRREEIVEPRMQQ